MKSLENEISGFLEEEGVDIIRYADITALPASINKGFPVAVLLGTKLTAGYLFKVSLMVNYVREMKRQNRLHEDEFQNAEHKTDRLADSIADFLISQGYSAYSQSEKNLLADGSYNTGSQTTVLPHKTIALLAGMGWIGKHDLLVTPDYGSAISMCTVLTDAPLPAKSQPVFLSRCGDCTVCRDVCEGKAISGMEWMPQISRDDLVDVHACTTCLKCMVLCPFTRQYIRNELSHVKRVISTGKLN